MLPSEDDVHAYMDGIPSKLRKCAAAEHTWQDHNFIAYTGGGKIIPKGGDLSKLRSLDVTEICGGRTGCGLKRHYTISVRGGRYEDQSDFTYSDRNKEITSPQGISYTGISVRKTLRRQGTLDRFMGKRIQLAPTGATKRALQASSKGAA